MPQSKEQTSQVNNLDCILLKHHSVTLEQGQYGTCLLIENNSACARLSLFGGQLLSFKAKHDNKERLWLSENAIFDGRTPIRGGVPICWPWFGSHKVDPSAPSHGFVRTQMWQLLDIVEQASSQQGIVSTTCRLAPTVLGMFDTPPELGLLLTIRIADTCELSLTTQNHSASAVNLSQAIHTSSGISNTDPIARKAISHFCQIMGSFAGNLALNLSTTGGIFIGGGITSKLQDFFLYSRFREKFEAKGDMSNYVKSIPTYLINEPDHGLLGALAFLIQHTQRKQDEE